MSESNDSTWLGQPSYPSPVIVIIDVANVLGSRPDGWWRDRASAAARLLDRLAALPGAEVTDPDGHPARIDRLIAVLEGTARAVPAPAPAALEVVLAEHDGDAAIVVLAEELPADATVMVVTADRGLRQRLPAGTVAVGPNWLNRLVGR
jgi:hypothetical protein